MTEQERKAFDAMERALRDIAENPASPEYVLIRCDEALAVVDAAAKETPPNV